MLTPLTARPAHRSGPSPSSLIPTQRAPEPAAPLAQTLTLTLTLDQTLVRDPDLLRAELSDLLESRVRTIEVDLSAVPVLPAAALGSLLEADSVLRCRGGRLRLLNATPRTLKVLAASRALHLADTEGRGAPGGDRQRVDRQQSRD